MRQVVFTEKGVPPGGPYSQVVVLNGVAYIAGQGSFVPRTGVFKPGSFAEQAEQTLQNIGILLEACGSSFEQVAKVSVFLANIDHFAELNAIYTRYFKEPYPVRTTVQANLIGQMLIEIDCIAEVTQK